LRRQAIRNAIHHKLACRPTSHPLLRTSALLLLLLLLLLLGRFLLLLLAHIVVRSLSTSLQQLTVPFRCQGLLRVFRVKI
jgi:hypothetical protein